LCSPPNEIRIKLSLALVVRKADEAPQCPPRVRHPLCRAHRAMNRQGPEDARTPLLTNFHAVEATQIAPRPEPPEMWAHKLMKIITITHETIKAANEIRFCAVEVNAAKAMWPDFDSVIILARAVCGLRNWFVCQIACPTTFAGVEPLGVELRK
jgi:hypothetical protein